MANFKTHVQFATIGSGLASTLFLKSQIITEYEAILCWLGGSLGGILPDIDSDNSHSLGILFGIFSLIMCIAIVFYGVQRWPLLHVWGICIVALLVLNLAVRKVFEWFTIHRGIFHSLLAAVFTLFLVAVIGWYSGLSPKTSWFLALFTSFGFILHLLLDEIYAVDFMGVSLKRSFGSAFKIFDYGNWKTALSFCFCIFSLFFLLPPSDKFLDVMLNKETYSSLASSLSFGYYVPVEKI